ncbi:hypothetical protein SFRURICE_011301, partial [Spodoptera frugiperda]
LDVFTKFVKLYRQAFYTRKGRQRCTLRHVMPACCHEFVTLSVHYHVILFPTRQLKAELLARQSHLRPLDQLGSRKVLFQKLTSLSNIKKTKEKCHRNFSNP